MYKNNRVGLELHTQSFGDKNLPNFRISSFFKFFGNSSRTKFSVYSLQKNKNDYFQHYYIMRASEETLVAQE